MFCCRRIVSCTNSPCLLLFSSGVPQVPAGGSVTRSVKLNFTAPGLFKIVCCFSLQDGEWWCEDVPAKVRVIVPSV